MSSMSQNDLRKLAIKLFMTYQVNSLPALAPLVYMMGLVTGLETEQTLITAAYVLPVTIPTMAAVVPFLFIYWSLRDAFTDRAGDTPERKLERILKIPRRIELRMVGLSVFGTLIYAAFPAFYFGKSLWIVPWASGLSVLQFMLLWINIRLSLEQIIAPYAVAQFRQLSSYSLQGSGMYWTRQKWYLPYAFGLYVICTLTLMASVAGKLSYSTFEAFFAQLHAQSLTEFETALRSTLSTLVNDLVVPMSLLGLYLLITAAVCAWRLASYQSNGALAVQKAIEALASGSPKLPEWVSTDEIGDLSLATAKVFVHLQRFALSLGGSANSLMESAQSLGVSTIEQNEMLSRQATALQETQVTTQEIKQTSELASQKAEGVLAQTDRAESISRGAEQSIGKTVGSLEAIREQVMEMANHINQLGGKTRQIANITATVKNLADQSNMLALNAAIEAVRSGEHGKGFGVVAREIRALADQSIRATNNVRQILEDISDAINTAVVITERGSARVDEGLHQVREFGDSIRQLSSIVNENGNAVRQISAAVAQQNVGIGEIFKAVVDMSAMMNQSVERLRASDSAVTQVRTVVQQVSQFVGSYDWRELGTTSTQQPPPQR
ncbi:methyl-accepting chemotaxis protein [Archangium minus]|uniref:Methyl-accepting chemotaxis protein n=2 Tax=Archangium minus TaxID=83450 RepID=A0ABY9WUQ5_9BACT|nr:methyl-accepting chemotaxis protein [Archangium minus]